MKGRRSPEPFRTTQRDQRVRLLCQHLRAAVDVLEQIAYEPLHPPETTRPETPTVIVSSPEIPPAKLAYSMKEAAAALGIGRTTIWKAITRGNLPVFKIGKRTLIPADGLRAWIAENRSAGEARQARS